MSHDIRDDNIKVNNIKDNIKDNNIMDNNIVLDFFIFAIIKMKKSVADH